MKDTTSSSAFSNLTKPRNSASLRHLLANILTIAICAIIFGCDDFNSMEEYCSGQLQPDTFCDISYLIGDILPFAVCNRS